MTLTEHGEAEALDPNLEAGDRSPEICNVFLDAGMTRLSALSMSATFD
jgi:hypothetical protein